MKFDILPMLPMAAQQEIIRVVAKYIPQIKTQQ